MLSFSIALVAFALRACTYRIFCIHGGWGYEGLHIIWPPNLSHVYVANSSGGFEPEGCLTLIMRTGIVRLGDTLEHQLALMIDTLFWASLQESQFEGLVVRRIRGPFT